MKGNHISYSETWTDESENDWALANILRVLKAIYRFFFFYSSCGDVGTYLPKVYSGIIEGCALLFNDVGDFIRSKSTAEEMVAMCTIVIDS